MRAAHETQQPQPAAHETQSSVEDSPRAVALGTGHEAEVLGFLSARPVHTVYMAGLIRDNGLVARENRGAFYGCRGERGRLEGVALVGHVTQVEARSDRALRALARAAQCCSSAHVIMGEQERIRAFWEHYAEARQPARLACRELLCVKTWPLDAVGADAPELRPATPTDLPLVAPAQAGMAFGMRTTRLELAATAARASSSEGAPISAAGRRSTASETTAAPIATTAHM